ncbi:glycosyltransferase family 4 protein [Corynebacterium sp. HMSC071B10]|uniref:glycosyltransferase family 4 protein n=1 Tax=Corynebacterium sp. HMSC071B10 TaxID=1739494 RepID=UPI0008A54796|nr:glycosyltransferase family 4 protein [Corynebacterium sp. HMSC071B10]
MKILVFSNYWHPQNGVPQRRWHWLGGMLSDRGHQISVITPPSNYRRNMSFKEWCASFPTPSVAWRQGEPGDTGETIFRTPVLPSGSSLTSRALSQGSVAFSQMIFVFYKYILKREQRPDLLIGTVPALPTAGVTLLAARLLRIPYVIDLRDAWPDLLKESDRWNESIGVASLREVALRKGPLQMIKFLTENMLNIALSNSDGVMVTSSWLRDELSRREGFKNRKKAPHLLTVRNVFPQETPFVKKCFDLKNENELNVLYAGTIGRAQDLENVLKAASIAGKKGVSVNLRFIGAGDGRQKLVESARKLGVNASFEQRKNSSEMTEPYDWADTALVHLADWEPLERTVPSKTFELMGARIHICGVVQGETAELIEKTGAGDVVKPGAPEELARLWGELLDNPASLEPRLEAYKWVESERAISVGSEIDEFMKRIESGV